MSPAPARSEAWELEASKLDKRSCNRLSRVLMFLDNVLQIGDVQIPGRVLAAPMTGISDLPFRRIASRCGVAYVATEMVACDSLARGRPDVVRRAAIGEGLPLMVVQLVGRSPEWIAKGAKLAEQAGAHIIDLNMGCPAKEVTGSLSGSALMREPILAGEMIRAAVQATTRPVTLKMRLGWDDSNRNAPDIAAMGEKLGLKAVTVHARTRQQFYSGCADWRQVADVKAATSLPVIVNGDIRDVASARAALKHSGADAIMVGRGGYGRPWFASALNQALALGEPLSEPGLAQRLSIVLEHFMDTLRFYGDGLGLKIFRKHLGWYIEQALCPLDPLTRRMEKSRLCRIDNAHDVESALTELWAGGALPIAAGALI